MILIASLHSEPYRKIAAGLFCVPNRLRAVAITLLDRGSPTQSSAEKRRDHLSKSAALSDGIHRLLSVNCNVIIEVKTGESNKKSDRAEGASRNGRALQTDLWSGDADLTLFPTCICLKKRKSERLIYGWHNDDFMYPQLRLSDAGYIQ